MMIITIDGEDEPATPSDPFAEIHRHPPIPSAEIHRQEHKTTAVGPAAEIHRLPPQ
ncbi:hypothetical protein Hanom_Chr04g00354051 [Helianthus anomalus]